MTTAAPANRDTLAPLTLIAFVLMLALVAARATVSEWAGDVGAVASTAAADAGPGPTTTIVLNFLCVVPALLVLIRRAIDPTYVLRWTPPHWLMLAIVMWLTFSSLWASNKADALLSASTWWAAVAIFWAAGQLVRSWTRLRPALAVAAGLLMIFAAQSIIYRFYELPELQRYWDTDPQIKERREKDPTDFTLGQMDKAVHGGQQQGFFRSPNTFACIAVLAGFVTAGLAMQRLMQKDEPAFAAILAVPLLAIPSILWWSGSRTAAATAAIGAIALPLAWHFRDRVAPQSRNAFYAGVGVFLLGVAFVIALGTSTGGLLQNSLTFRWHYWVASWHLLLAQPLRGVGWANFGSHYLAFRLPVAPEEVKDPHNFFVHFATETGVIGLVLAAAWLGLTLWQITRPVEPRTPVTLPGVRGGPSWLKPALAIAAIFWLLRTATLWPLSTLLTEAGKTLLFALCLLTAMLLAGVRNSKEPDADDRPARFAVWATVVGLLTFVLHNQVDFAIFETGPLLLFVLLTGGLLGIRQPSAAGQKTQTIAAIGSLAGAFAFLLGAIGLWAVPTMLGETKVAAAEAAGRAGQPSAALDLYREAVADAPVQNPDYPRHAARWADPSKPEDAIGWLNRAVAADPADCQNWLQRARFNAMAHSPITITANDYAQFVARNPNDAPVRLEYAHVLDAAGLTDAAIEQYHAALAANDGLKTDEIRRLPAEQVTQIKQRLAGK